MHELIADLQRGITKGCQNPGWSGRGLEIRQRLRVELFKVTTTMDLLVIFEGFQMADHFGPHR